MNGSRISKDWRLTDELRDWAIMRLGVTREDVEFEAEQFKDYWMACAGRSAFKLDWDATWRVWMRRSAKDSAKKGRGGLYQMGNDELFVRAREAGISTVGKSRQEIIDNLRKKWS